MFRLMKFGLEKVGDGSLKSVKMSGEVTLRQAGIPILKKGECILTCRTSFRLNTAKPYTEL